jgi:hypothetical protein
LVSNYYVWSFYYNKNISIKRKFGDWAQWLIPVIPATQEEIGRAPFEVSQGKKLARPHINKQAGCGCFMPVIPAI